MYVSKSVRYFARFWRQEKVADDSIRLRVRQDTFVNIIQYRYRADWGGLIHPTFAKEVETKLKSDATNTKMHQDTEFKMVKLFYLGGRGTTSSWDANL